jgi:sec-independent protein translocase protein TatC
MDTTKASFIEHLGELRKRIIIIAMAVLAGSLLSYYFVEELVDLLADPVKHIDMIFLSPPDLFLAHLKIAVIAGVVITAPITLFQIWIFLKPGLKKTEQRYGLFAVFMGTLFFLLGVSFAFFVIIPMSIDFFLRMSTDQVQPMFSFANYLSYCGSLIISFGIVFQLPMVIILLSQLNLVTSRTFRKHRKFFILGVVLLSAILTPPDIISQFLMSGPLIILYEFSILVARIIERKRKNIQAV